VHALERQRNKVGEPYILGHLVKQAERLREYFELAALGNNQPVDWLGAIRTGHTPQAGPTTQKTATRGVAMAQLTSAPVLVTWPCGVVLSWRDWRP
jgi:hypothetical protein